MKRILFFIFIFNNALFSQQVELTNLPSLQLKNSSFVGFDSLGDYYYFDDNQTFHKHSTDNDWEYANINYGKIVRADIQNPLKIVLFYESFNAVVILDNQLNEIQKINFSDIDSSINALAVGNASNNQLWVFDGFSQQIGLFDYKKKEFRTISTPLKDGIKYYQPNLNKFYFIDLKGKVFSIDIYGKIIQIGSCDNSNSVINIDEKKLIVTRENKVFLLNFSNNTTEDFPVQLKKDEKLVFKNQILSIFTNEEIINYKIK